MSKSSDTNNSSKAIPPRMIDSSCRESVSDLRAQSLAGAVVSFGRLLKDNGFAVSIPSVMDALLGIRCVGVEDVHAFKTVLAAMFLSRVEETASFNRLFWEFWLKERMEAAPPEGPSRQSAAERGDPESLIDGEDVFGVEAALSDSQESQAREARPYMIYSPVEILRDQDFKEVPEGEDHRMARLIRDILAPMLRRIGVRKRSVESGTALDFRRLFRKNVRYGGEIFELPRLKPRRRIKRVVFLCDVSGSMNLYLQFMLRFIKELQELPTRVETFVFATQLHRVTPFLVRFPFPKAMREIARTVRDWSGGTRIGECLQEFTAYRGGGMIGSSTVVLIHSDGWDRGDPNVLETEMKKIRRRAYRVLWINPLLGSPLYEPTCRGMRTALPHVDGFLPGHNITALERVARTLRSLL